MVFPLLPIVKNSSTSIHYLQPCAEENMMSELHTLELYPQPPATARATVCALLLNDGTPGSRHY